MVERYVRNVQATSSNLVISTSVDRVCTAQRRNIFSSAVSRALWHTSKAREQRFFRCSLALSNLFHYHIPYNMPYLEDKKIITSKENHYHLHILRGRIYFLNCIPGYHDFCAYPAIKNRYLTGWCRTIILIPWTSVSRRTKIGQFYRTISSLGLTQCVGGIIIEEKLCRISATRALSTHCAAWKRRQKYKEERVCLKTYIKTSASAACACR